MKQLNPRTRRPAERTIDSVVGACEIVWDFLTTPLQPDDDADESVDEDVIDTEGEER